MHYTVACIIENVASLLISIIYKGINLSEFFTKLIIYIILILAALVYNWFIILNFCGFQKYTKLFLQFKANQDIKQTNL